MYKRLAVLCAAAALTAAAALAQPGMRPRSASGTAPDPTAQITMRVNMLAAQLSLSDGQKAQAITIFTNAQTAAAAVQTSIQTRRSELRTAIKANNTGGIDAAALALGALEGQATAINAKAEAAFYALLTTDQQKLYDAMPGGAMGGGMGGPGRGPGGMGRGGRPPR